MPEFVKTIPKIILNNYKILRKLNSSGRTIVSREKLQVLGFHFGYITSFYTTKKGDVYSFCFDQVFLKIKDDQVLLVVQQSQVELN